MARAGAARPCKVLSSGRHAGAARVPSGRKRFGLRKECHPDVEAGYSLYSTDSDDQVDTIHNGLDRCATLLKNILQNEATVQISNKKLASSTTPSAEKDLSSGQQNQLVPPIHMPCSQQSPVVHQKLCERLQTQMSLVTGQPPQNSNQIPTVTPFPTSDHGYQNVTAFNYRLPTSTVDLSLQCAANPLPTQSDVPVNSGNEYVAQTRGTVAFPVVSNSTTPQTQSASALPGVMPCIASGASRNSTVPTFTPSSVGREMTPSHEQQRKEADLIRCIQAHLSLLQLHEMPNGRTDQKHCHHCPATQNVSTNREEDTFEELSEEDDLNVLDVAPVRDTSCQRSFVRKDLKQRQESPEKTAHKVKTVKYLLGELRALITDQGD